MERTETKAYEVAQLAAYMDVSPADLLHLPQSLYFEYLSIALERVEAQQTQDRDAFHEAEWKRVNGIS